MWLVGVALVLAAIAPAFAQSKRYPPEPVDRDREAADKSRLWDNATNPRTRPYQDLLTAAQRDLSQRTDDAYRGAIAALDNAIKLQPNEPAAYELRGTAFMELREWAKCADDLATAAAKSPRQDGPRRAATEQRRKLGLCQARAGKLADAERTLSEAAIAGTGTGEMLMRLGEVRIAMGKLDEAIAALTAALDAPDIPSQALTRWLLASAFDRARRPSEALAEARRAANIDRSYGVLTTPTTPLVGAGESEYLLGLAWSTNEPPRPEYAIAYFRRFLRIAPESPWRKRAEEHLRELRGANLPEALERKGGVGALDLDVARDIVRRAMPQMRQCMAKLPSTVLEVTITKSGPRTKLPDVSDRASRYRRIAPPPDGIAITHTNLEAVARADTDAAARCIEPIATRIAMPGVKEKDAWYRVGFFVVGP